MSNYNELGTLENMTQQILDNFPDNPTDAVNKYLSTYEEDFNKKPEELKNRLDTNPAYMQKFQIGMSHTSIMIFLISRKAQTFDTKGALPEIDLEQYTREFLFFSRQDDKEIYDMKMYYLNSLDADTMGIGEVSEDDYDSKEEFQSALKEGEKIKSVYNKLLNNFKNQYKETKIHLA